MDRNLWVRLGLIVAIVGISGYLLWPSYRYFSTYKKLTSDQIAKLPEAERRSYKELTAKSMKLGLDLQGGMHMVLEMDESKGKIQNKADAQDRVMQILDTRIDKFGVTEPTIAKQGDSRVMVQLPGIDDPARARELVQATAQLEFRIVSDQDEVVRVVQKLDEELKKQAAAEKAANPSSVQTEVPGATPPAIPGVTSDSTKAASDSLFPEFNKETAKSEAHEASADNPFSGLVVAFQSGRCSAGRRLPRAEGQEI